MPDVDMDERLRALDALEPPDLWEDVRGRQPRIVSHGDPHERWPAIGLALAASAVGVILIVRAFLGGGPLAPPVELGGRSNGRIAFLEGRMNPGGSDAQIYVINPDGTGREPLTQGLRVGPFISWSPDGSRLAFVQGGGEFQASNIFVMNADGSGVRQLTHGVGIERNSGPAWSPDGTRIAFSRATSASGGLGPYQLYAMGPSGSNLEQLTECDSSECARSGGDVFPSWSPDGSQMVFRRSGELWVLDVATRQVRALCPTCNLHGAAVWSPDGDVMAFVGAQAEILTLRSEGSELRTLFRPQSGSDLFGLSWSPDGRFMAFGLTEPDGGRFRGSLIVMNADGTGVRKLVTGSADGSVLCCPAWQPQAAPPGPEPSTRPPLTVAAEIWFRRGSGEGGVWIESIDPDGSNRQVLFTDTYAGGTDDVGMAYDWSPDGSRLAFIDSTRYIGEVPTGSSWDVYVMNDDGTGRYQVTDDGGFDAAPSWSPDGNRIVYASDRGDPNRPACQVDITCNRDIFVVNADGTGQSQITDEPGADWQPDWGTDGRIAFVSERDGASGDIYVMNADGTEVVRVTATPQHEYQPRWSPDGSHVAFVRMEGDSASLFVMDAKGSNEVEVGTGLPVSHSVEPDILDDFAWSPDGSMITFVAGGDLATTLFVVGLDGQGLRALVQEPSYGVSGPAWRPATGGDAQGGKAAGSVLSPAPRECPVGFTRSEGATATELPEVTHGHIPTVLPGGFGLQRAYKGNVVSATWTDGRCRSITVNFSLGDDLGLHDAAVERVGPWFLEYDRPEACGNSIMGMGRCIGYSGGASDGAINIQTIGLSREEADAVVLSIPL